MGVPQGVTDTFGGLGGAVLATCVLPQLWKVWLLKSARDLSLSFLLGYLIAMLCSLLYLYYEEATVGWICCSVQLGCLSFTISFKLYFDHFGPNSRRGLKRARPEARLTSSPSFAAEVGLSVHDVGTAFARLLAPAPTHAAHHLLLDARLHLAPEGISNGKMCGDTGSEDKETSSHGSGRGACDATQNGTGSFSIATAVDGIGSPGGLHKAAVLGNSSTACVLEVVGGMMEEALAGAGLLVRRRQSQAFPSFRRRGGAAAAQEAGQPSEAAAAEAAAEANAEAAAEAEAAQHGPDMLFLACRGGYATAVWHAASSTLSLDMLAASDAAAGAMAAAAQALCGQLVERWPGSRIEASSVERLPRKEH